MDPCVAQFEHASLQSCHEPPHVQQDRVERDPSLVAWRSARRVARLLLHLETCQICGESSNAGYSLHDLEWKYEVVEWGWARPRRKSETATERPRAPEPTESPTL